MMPAPPTLTLVSLDEGQDTSVMSLTAGAGATSARVAAAPGRRGSLLTASRHSGMVLGRGWPGDEQTPRAVAPPVRAGDAVHQELCRGSEHGAIRKAIWGWPGQPAKLVVAIHCR